MLSVYVLVFHWFEETLWLRHLTFFFNFHSICLHLNWYPRFQVTPPQSYHPTSSLSPSPPLCHYESVIPSPSTHPSPSSQQRQHPSTLRNKTSTGPKSPRPLMSEKANLCYIWIWSHGSSLYSPLLVSVLLLRLVDIFLTIGLQSPSTPLAKLCTEGEIESVENTSSK